MRHCVGVALCRPYIGTYNRPTAPDLRLTDRNRPYRSPTLLIVATVVARTRLAVPCVVPPHFCHHQHESAPCRLQQALLSQMSEV